MANIFQKIGQKFRDVVGGVGAQLNRNDGGKDFRSYMEEEERRRKQQQQEAAARAQQQIAQRNAAAQNQPRMSVAAPTPQPKLSISQPNQPKLNTQVVAPAVTPTIKVPQPAVPKPALPDQEFKTIENAGQEQKKLFGKNMAWALPKGYETVEKVQVKNNYKTNKDKFVAQFDAMDQERREIYLRKIRELAKNKVDDQGKEIPNSGDPAAVNSLRELEAANRAGSQRDILQRGADIASVPGRSVIRVGTGITQGVSGTVDLVTPGKGTSRVSSFLDQAAKEQDVSAEEAGVGTGYKVMNVPVEIASYFLPATAAGQIVAKFPKGVRITQEVVELISKNVDKAGDANKVRRFLADRMRKGWTLDRAVEESLQSLKYTGENASKGNDTSPESVFTDVATSVGGSLLFPNKARRAIQSNDLDNAGIRLADDIDTSPLEAPQLNQAEQDFADRAADALMAGDDDALRAAEAEFDRIRALADDVPNEPTPPPIFTQTSPDVPQPPIRESEGLIPDRGDVTGGILRTADDDIDVGLRLLEEPEIRTATLEEPTPLAPEAPEMPELPRDLEDRLALLEEEMVANPTPEIESALNEARREVAARQAAVANRSVVATPNDELINAGVVTDEVEYLPLNELELGGGTYGAVDRSAVDQYKEMIRNGQPLDPIVVKTDANGRTTIEDGKHRALAMYEEGVDNAPASRVVEAAPASFDERIAKFTDMRAAITNPNDPKAIELDKTIERLIKQAGEPGSKVRGFSESVIESPKTSPEVHAGIGDETYDPITNVESLRQADDIIRQNPEAAIQRAKTEGGYSRETQAISMRLIDELQSVGRYDDAIDVIEATAARATEAGQATQILAAYNRLTPEGILAAAQREVTNAQKLNPEKYRNLRIDEATAANLRKMAEDLQKIPAGTPERKLATRKLLDEISRVVPTPGTRKFVTIWKAGLLTGLKGAVAGNAVGNASAAIIRKIADVPAAMLDTAIAKATGHRSKVFTLRGLFGGFGEGIKVGAKNFKEGVGMADEAIKLDYKKVNFGRGKLGRAAQKYTDSVFNFYSAADRPFYHAALRNNLQDLAKVEARNLGLRGSDARTFVKQTIAEPPDEILTQAVAAAEEATFQASNPLRNALSSAKRGLSAKGGAGELVAEGIMPFTGVPAAIAKQVYDYSPAGAVVNTLKAIKQAATGNFDQAMQRRLTEALGRGITGTGLIWIGSQLHNDGLMTLGWPTDPKERALWESEGKTPYSVKIGGKWRSMNYMGSLTSLMAIGGQIDSAAQEGGGFKAIPQGVMASGKAIVGSTPLQGVQGAMDAVTDPERFGEKFVNNTVSSVVPTLVKDIAVAGDPMQREVNSVADAIQARIPGARNGLPAKVDVFGNDMERATTALGSIIDPFKSSQGKETDVTREMRRLQDGDQGVNPPKIDKKATFDGVEVELDPDAIRDLTKRTNLKVQEAWSMTMATPEYQALSDEDKRKALSNVSGDIAAAERVRYAADKQLGQFAPDAATNGHKPTKLSGKQEAILGAEFDPLNYTNGEGDRIAKDVSSTSRDTLTKINSMTSEKKGEYLKDPKNDYAYNLAKYENDLRAGKLSDVDQYERVQKLGSLKIKSNYSREANELYGLSEKKLNDFLDKKGGVSEKVLAEVLAMDAQLAAEGYISKEKFGGGINGGKGAGKGGGKRAAGRGKKEKTIKVPLPSFGSFKLVEAPKTPAPTMQSVLSDLQKMFADIKILQGVQIAPGDDGSEIQITV